MQEEIIHEVERGKIYIIEALFPFKKRQNYMPAVVKFCPGISVFDSACALLTKYSDIVYMLEFVYRTAANEGVFEPVSQIKFKQKGLDHTVTLFYDGFYYARFENQNAIINKKINADNVSLSTVKLKQDNIAYICGRLEEGKKYCLFVYFDEDYVFEEYIADSVEFDENTVTIKNNLCDMRSHSQTIKLDFSLSGLNITDKNIKANKPCFLTGKLLPYYFLEAVAAQDFTEAAGYLDAQNYGGITPQQINDFFGEFCGIIQNTYQREYCSYVAIKKKESGNMYKLKYYDFVIRGEKIENILSID